jgi:hypothetical protein
MYKGKTFGTLRKDGALESARQAKSRHTKSKDKRNKSCSKKAKIFQTIMTSMADALRRRIVVAIATERATFHSSTIIDRNLAFLPQTTKEPDSKSKAEDLGPRVEHHWNTACVSADGRMASSSRRKSKGTTT